MKVFISRKIPEAGLQYLREAGIEISEWTTQRDLTAAELIEHCKGADAFLSAGGNRIDKTFLQAAAHLKVISLHSAGYDNVDIAAATAIRMPIGNTPGVLSDSTADVAFLLIIATSRKAFYMHKMIQRGAWGFFEPTANLGMDIRGKTLGIFGLGKIGFELAKRCAAAFKMEVIYHNRGYHPEADRELGAIRVSFSELLERSDVLSVNSGLTSHGKTKGKFDKDVFASDETNRHFHQRRKGAKTAYIMRLT